jgi:diguanylate cyclase (GGDEF)-like protein
LLIDCSQGPLHASQREYARAFARRFAVALGSEDRRQALLRQAYYDDLTGLPNRQLFKDRLTRELAHAKRAGVQMGVIFIDLDRFKHVNDSLGHSAGDELLQAVSVRLSGLIRDCDTLARLGGDEFIVIASDLANDPTHVLAERLQVALRQPFVIQNTTCVMAASLGMTVYPRDGDSAEVLLRNADTAMYRAKAAGGGHAVYFEETMNHDAQRRLLVEQRLRTALRDRKLHLFFQPKISLLDGSVCGVEALARWTDAELGFVSPAIFIPIAEECGLIEELGLWALREACETFQGWMRDGCDVRHVSVNASMRQLRDRSFVQEVIRVLHDTGMRADALEIEVTESTLAHRPKEVTTLLDELRIIGVRISIDDFGTGYSSMAALSQIPADVLKIDRSFVNDCATRPEAASIVEAIISMAHALGKVTVAEGVETPGQLAVLRRLGCDAVQGYLFAKPMSPEQLRRFPLKVGLAAVGGNDADAAPEVLVAMR